MYNIYQIIENVVLFISRDVVSKMILPLLFLFLAADIIRYLFSKDAKKETILDSLKAKAIGFIILIFLPFIMLWFLGFVQQVTGVKPNVDTSILQKLNGGKSISQTTTTTPDTNSVVTVNPAS